MTLTTKIPNNSITNKIRETFTIESDTVTFETHEKPFTGDFQIGYITGSSGSGKSILLKEYGKEINHKWDKRPICDHFSSYEDAESKLLGAGLSSIPAWLLPYELLSTGQKYRANLAIGLKDGAVFDEFTGYLDRNTAKSVTVSIKRYIKDNNIKNVIFCGPHHDIIQYLEPDWVYDCDLRTLYSDSTEQQSEIVLEIN